MDPVDTRPPTPPECAKLIVYEGNLYTETGRPLYRYFPLGQLSQRGLTVPYARHWDDYIQAWVYTYPPMPRTTSDTPAINKGGLGHQDRPDAGHGRAYPQAVYRGWPLYLCDLDTASFERPPQGTVPGLFEMVSVCEPPVVWKAPPPSSPPHGGPPDVGWPPVFSGP